MIVADVYKGQFPAATLERRRESVFLAYLADYIGDPIARTLPVRAEPYVAPAGQLPAYLTGLLPEGRRLTALRRSLKVSADDELSLLLAVGADTIGDIRVVSAGTAPSEPDPIVDGWEDVDLAALFAHSIDAEYDRLAIPGVQDKVSGRMVSFPAATGEGPVIIKLNPPEYRDLVRNEAAMLDAAAATGLYRVPAHALVTDAHGNEGLVVTRFDREGSRRLPVEDGCQALARYPADKYNLDTIDVISGLSDWCSAPVVARLQLLARFLLSYLVGDGDMHARNLAIYQATSGLWEPTPVYDLVCTALYNDSTLAAPLNGGQSVRELGRRRFIEVAGELGVPPVAVEGMLNRYVPVIAAAAAEGLSSPSFGSFPTRRKVERMLVRRAKLLL